MHFAEQGKHFQTRKKVARSLVGPKTKYTINPGRNLRILLDEMKKSNVFYQTYHVLIHQNLRMRKEEEARKA